MSKTRILIIDDNPQWRSVLRESLMPVSEIYEAESYERTANLLASKEIDLAIVDLRLTDYDSRDVSGMHILAQLAKLNIPAIVMSAYGTPEGVRTAFVKYKVKDYFDKSNFELVDFRNAISRILRQVEKTPINKKQKKS